MPNLDRLVLGNIAKIAGVEPVPLTPGACGRLTEVRSAKNTTTGNWELSGVTLNQAFPVHPYGFPNELISGFDKNIGRETLGNYPASGTEIIKELALEHILTGKPIVYTSAYSVFQLAAHEEVIPIDELYRYCQTARDLKKPEFNYQVQQKVND